MARKPKLPPNVSVFVDRHGKQRYRWRCRGRSAYLPGHPDTPESKALLAKLEAEKGALRPIDCAAPGSVDDTPVKPAKLIRTREVVYTEEQAKVLEKWMNEAVEA